MVHFMGAEYPYRPPMAIWIRIPILVFGIACLIGLLQETWANPNLSHFLGGGLVSALWIAFGAYGGCPLVDTVQDWEPPANPDEVTQMDLKGLTVIRRRR